MFVIKFSSPLYLSTLVIKLFKEYLKGYEVIVFDERDIFKANSKLDLQKLYKIRGGLRQQVIKSEFWRLGISENYLVLDSDCIFIRDFDESDFIFSGDVPYSIIHEGRDVLQATERFGPKKIRQHFLADREPIKAALGRKGVTYDFGYAPFLWSRKVWESLDQNYLTPNNLSFLDAVKFCPSEFTWYGESLMKYQAIIVSDLHLGTKDSKSEEFIDFIETHQTDLLILNGDIIDGWAINRGSKWKKQHTKVISKLLKLSKYKEFLSKYEPS